MTLRTEQREPQSNQIRPFKQKKAQLSAVPSRFLLFSAA